MRPGQAVCPNCGGVGFGVESSHPGPVDSMSSFTPDVEFGIVVGSGGLLELPAKKNIRTHHLRLTGRTICFTCGVFDSMVEFPCSAVTAVLPKQTESGIFSKVNNFFLCFTAEGKVYEFEFASGQSLDYRSTEASKALLRLIAELRRFVHAGGRG